MSFLESYRENNDEFHAVICNPKFPSHFHKNPEILYPIDGDVEVVVNGKNAVVKKGYFAFFDCYDIHHILGDSTSLVVCIPIPYVGDWEKFTAEKTLKNKLVKDDGTVFPLCEKFLKINGLNELEKKGLVNCLLGKIADLAGFEPKKEQKCDLVVEVAAFMRKEYSQKISLDSLAKRFNYSKYTLSHNFKKQTGMDVRSYLNEIRLNEFLRRTDGQNASTVKTAFDVGFESVQTFYRIYKKRFGTSPKRK